MKIEDRNSDVAVIGMACRFPGARDIAEFWKNLREGVESITFFSEAELLQAGVSPETLKDPSFVRAYGALEDADAFDAAFFGVSQREAQVIDPQHRVLLECAWTALEDAGYDPGRFEGAIGVYAGSGFSPYLWRVMGNRDLVSAVGETVTFFANDKDYLTTRVSYKLGLRGPSVVVQTACSTSLVAIHLACQSLLNRECDMALSGGVSIAPDQVRGYYHQAGGINSPDGHCRTFDAQAAGTVGGSGAGLVVLKRLTDALRDGDTVHAVVKGSAINNDGSAKIGYTAPSVEGQVQVIAEALSVAGVDPATVSFVEAHGTGTPLGDPIETAALKEVFGAAKHGTRYCALGAVKTNIGHLDAAAGVAGFIKAALALKHRTIPPTLHFVRPNPETGIEDSPFYVNTEELAWPDDERPGRACVSSFGIGGTNAHVVLEAAPDLPQLTGSGGDELLVLSARSEAALDRVRSALAEHLRSSPDLPLDAVAHTLQVGRAAHMHRWAGVVRSHEEAAAALAEPGVHVGLLQAKGDRPLPVAFLFPGQGAQYPGMAKELYDREPDFRREVDRCAEALLADLGMDLRSALFPPDAADAAAHALLEQTRYTQPALFVVEYALARLWMAWGVRPESMLGHSIGEYVAACLAGVFSLESALRLVAARGRLMQGLPKGAMLAVPLTELELRPMLSEALALAAVNSTAHCVISGHAADIAALEARLAGREVSSRRLHTSHAFHSPAMDPILEAFAAEVRAAAPTAPELPFISNVTGDWITPELATDPWYWARHLRGTVRFADGVGRLFDDAHRVLLEVGPGETLGAFARRHERNDGSRMVVRSLARADQPQSARATMLEAVGALWRARVVPDWAAMRGPGRLRRVPLPTYPFERQVYRIPQPVNGAAARLSAGGPPAESRAPDVLPTEPRPPQHAGRTVETRSSPVPARASGMTARVTMLFGRLLGQDASRLDPSRSFLELGADSLLLMQASRTIESEFGVKVPFRSLMDGMSTIDELSAHLGREAPKFAAEGAEPVHDRSGGPAPEPESAWGPLPADAGDVSQPVAAARGAADQDAELQEIIAQQLAVVQKQLELLRGTAVPSAAPPVTRSWREGDRPPLLGTERRPAAENGVGRAQADAGAHGPHRPVRQTLGRAGAFDERQARYVEEFTRRYTSRTRCSKEYAAAHRSALADNRASLNFRLATKELVYPIVGERSEGCRLWDLDGNEYVDFTMGFGVHFFGHRPPFVLEALEAQLRRGFHVGPQSDLAGPAAALVRELTGMDRVTFCNTGSEAVMTALRLARAVTGRERIVIFEGAYHGCFDGVLARTSGDDPERPRSLPLALGTPQGMVDDVVILPYGASSALDYLKRQASRVAAVLVEPIQNRDPEFQPVEFLHNVRSLTRTAGAVLIFDEMISGFRFDPRGAQGLLGVDADVATYGKVVAGGLPIGVVAGRPSLLNAIDGGAWSYGDLSYPAADQTFFAGTFCKHPLAMAATVAVLRHLKERGPELYEEINTRTARLVGGIRNVLREERVPIGVASFGSVFHFRFRPGDPFGDLLFYHMVERGIYVWEGRACFLSTAHTDADCQRLLDALRDSIRSLREGGFLSEDGGAARGARTPYPAFQTPPDSAAPVVG